MGKLYNEYDLSGDYGIGYTHNTKEEFFFDLEDYPEICMYTWSENDGKIVTFDYPEGKRKKIYLSRIVMKVEDREEAVKHYNGDTFDCRKNNLYVTRFKKEKRGFCGQNCFIRQSYHCDVNRSLCISMVEKERH